MVNKNGKSVRVIDDLGRAVIPKKIRDRNNWLQGTEIEIIESGQDLIIRKTSGFCVICGKQGDFELINKKGICISCVAKVSKLYEF